MTTPLRWSLPAIALLIALLGAASPAHAQGGCAAIGGQSVGAECVVSAPVTLTGSPLQTDDGDAISLCRESLCHERQHSFRAREIQRRGEKDDVWVVGVPVRPGARRVDEGARHRQDHATRIA